LSAVTLKIEVPSATRSISTSVTPGSAFSSLVTAPTQCSQVSPVTGKIWVLIEFLSPCGGGVAGVDRLQVVTGHG
jgi:hypothetical protein